jgi:cytochrome c oxidase subunit 2
MRGSPMGLASGEVRFGYMKEDLAIVKRRSSFAWVVLLAMSAVAACVPATAAPQEAGATKGIQMTAKKYEFNPNVITVIKGEHVKLVITALDHEHGFKLEAFGVNQKLPKGVPTTIEFTANKAGTFPFQCSVFCGMGHRRMKGKLVVEEQ